MPTYTLYSPSVNTPGQFAALLLAGSSGLSIVPGSAMLTYASGRALDVADAPLTTSISSYDGSIAALGIGAGLLLTSGDAAPAARNTSSQYTVELDTSHLDADLTAAAKAGFPEAGMVQDATVLQFQFTVTDPALTGIQFDLVFGSDEYPEFSDTDFVDIGAVFVNGVNRALFNDKTDQPLSVIEKNLSDGGFRDNTDSAIPVEYDGVSVKLTIVAPVVAGVNTIKIAVGDTGDPSWDSGLFVSNLRAVAFSGTGLNKVIEGTGGADNLVTTSGNDFIDGGAGLDRVTFTGPAANYSIVRSGSSYLVTDKVGSSGTDTLVNIERLRFDDRWLALDLGSGQSAANTARLIGALFDTPYLTREFNGIGIKLFDNGQTLEQVAQLAIDTGLFAQLAGSRSNADFVKLVYKNVVGVPPSSADLAQYQGLLDRKEMTQAQLAVLAAGADVNGVNIDLVGLGQAGLEFLPMTGG